MANAKLLEAIKIAEKALQFRSSKPVRVCTNQCNILIAAFDHVNDFLGSIDELGIITKKEKTSPMWDELLAVMYRGLHTLTSCRGDNWIVRTLLSEDSREDFQDIISELYATVEVLSSYLFYTASSDSQRSKISEACGSCLRRSISSSMLQDAATTDRKQLMRMAISQDEILDRKQTLNEEDKALKMLCTVFLEKQPDGRVAINQRDLVRKDPIGGGAYGTVYEVEWLRHTFAMKVFYPGDQSFPRELAVLTSHKHPYVLHIVGHCFDSQRYSLVMEKMDMDLEAFVQRKNKSLSLPSRLSILLQVAKGMAWLHSRNVMHRDIKPQNVLVSTVEDEFLSVRIADFGLARTDFVTSLISKATSQRGTRHFMAPEVWSSNHYSKKADVYSYAMLSYQVLTGEVPFKEALKRSDFMDLVCNGTRPDLSTNSSLPTELTDLVKKCWSADAGDRPSFSEICNRLVEIKAKLLTGHDLANARVHLQNFGATATSQAAPQTSRMRVDLNSLISATRNLSTVESNNMKKEGSSSYKVTPNPVPNIRQELFQLVTKGQPKQAFEKALTLKDPSVVWYICSQIEPTLLMVLDHRMVLAIAEQIAVNLEGDTMVKLAWINQAVGILTADYSNWGSPKLEKFFEQLSASVHGQLAVTPKDSELAEALVYMRDTCNIWLQRVRTSISLFSRKY